MLLAIPLVVDSNCGWEQTQVREILLAHVKAASMDAQVVVLVAMDSWLDSMVWESERTGLVSRLAMLCELAMLRGTRLTVDWREQGCFESELVRRQGDRSAVQMEQETSLLVELELEVNAAPSAKK